MPIKLCLKLNAELDEQGYITVSGRVNRKYFMERTCYDTNEQKDGDSYARLQRIKNNTWKVYYRYTDWDGTTHQSTKSEALRPNVMRRHGNVNSIPIGRQSRHDVS